MPPSPPEPSRPSRRAAASRPAAFPVSLADLSLLGVGLRCGQRLPLDTRYFLQTGPGPLTLSARVRVISCRPRKDGTYDLGCEFA